MDLEIELPYLYSPRSYQIEPFEAFNNGIRRFVIVWHRRSGKDKTMLNFMICRMFERVGMYWYCLPTYEQARLTVWQGRGSGITEEDDGTPFIDHFPEALVEYKNEQRLEIGLANGSIFRLIGSDNVDRVVGANPIGIVYSEYSLQTPAAWDYVSPMLMENKGWAAFIFTPRGQNHAYDLYKAAEKSKGWFTSLKTIDDTYRDSVGENGEKVIGDIEIEEERELKKDENLIQQEYYCSFKGFREGSYYGEFMAYAQKDGRIGNVIWNPRVPVFTAWDLGIGDSMTIWFAQIEDRNIYLIDYYEESGKGLLHYISLVKNKPYVYSNHWAPSDIKNRQDMQDGTLTTRWNIARDLGITFNLVPRIPLQDGIDSARALIPRCHFDKLKCDQGIRALIGYHRDFDTKTQNYRNTPVHDWASHGADGFRYLSLIVDKEESYQKYIGPTKYEKDFSIFDYDEKDKQKEEIFQ